MYSISNYVKSIYFNYYFFHIASLLCKELSDQLLWELHFKYINYFVPIRK